ncbi:MAG: hypothetical protein HFF20_02230 [Oscillospiraceae bacterium]|nr:hypothetical protein [Oscillospiraceae bacterium]MCI9548034.1 hypothetical protein [Oscillospiraceae bacterium]
MDIFVSKGEHDHEVCIRLPAAPDMIWPMLTELDRCSVSGGPAKITGTSLFLNLAQYISGADLEEEADIRRLNVLAGMVDGMSVKDQQLLSGALDAESVNGLDDVLRVVYSLGQYEFIEGVTTDKELGGWLVEHGLAEVDFPKDTWPYLDYAGIGRSYYADHGGAYTPSGYVKRREAVQMQAEETRPTFALTLVSPTSTCRLGLPAADDELEQAKRALRLDDLGSAVIKNVEIDYPWAHLLDMDSITLQDAHILAKCVQEMTAQELRVFGAVLEAEQPSSFSDANLTAMYLDDYELVEDSEREYGREALRKAGADDEILDMLDGFTDFDALGRSEMEADGVRETSFGHVRRLSAPWPEHGPEMGQTMG